MGEGPLAIVMDAFSGAAAGRTVLSFDVERYDRMHRIIGAHDLNIFQLRRF